MTSNDSTTTALKECPEDGILAGWDGPGWYFRDETHHLHGPFSTIKECTEIETNYTKKI